MPGITDTEEERGLHGDGAVLCLDILECVHVLKWFRTVYTRVTFLVLKLYYSYAVTSGGNWAKDGPGPLSTLFATSYKSVISK